MNVLVEIWNCGANSPARNLDCQDCLQDRSLAFWGLPASLQLKGRGRAYDERRKTKCNVALQSYS
jgi:hypothetical protein